MVRSRVPLLVAVCSFVLLLGGVGLAPTASAGPSAAKGAVVDGSISGLVTSTVGPVEGVYVLVSLTSVPKVHAYTMTAADGTYSISGLPADTYKVLVLDLGLLAGAPDYYIPQFYDNAGSTLDDFATATDVVVVDGVDTALNTVALEFNNPGGVTGVVKNDLGDPLEGMAVLVSPSAAPSVSAYAITAADGTYTVSGLAPGTYKIATIDLAMYSGPTYYNPEFYDNGGSDLSDFPTATTVTITASTSETLNDVQLTPHIAI